MTPSSFGAAQTGGSAPHSGGPGEPSSSVVSITSGVLPGLGQTGCFGLVDPAGQTASSGYQHYPECLSAFLFRPLHGEVERFLYVM